MTFSLEILAAHWERLADRFNRWSAKFTPLQFALFCAIGCLAVAVFASAPSVVRWSRFDINMFEWARASSVWQQAQAPFSNSDTEYAVEWRYLPAIAVYALGGNWWAVILVPWIGLLALLTGSAFYLDRLLADRASTVLAMTLFTTSGSVLTLTSFFGINDAWFLLALLPALFSRSSWLLFVAGLLGPWVDERFLLALPLAWLVRKLHDNQAANLRCFTMLSVGPFIYVVLRLGATLTSDAHGSSSHLQSHLHELPNYLPYLPLGWWMGYRFAWFPLIAALIYLWKQDKMFATGTMAAALLGMIAITFVAADLTRSTNLLFPLFLISFGLLQKQFHLSRSRRILALLTLGNLLTPFAWVSYMWIRWLWPAPAEIYRWITLVK